MKKLKGILTLLMALSLSLGVAACNVTDSTSGNDSSSNPTSDTASNDSNDSSDNTEGDDSNNSGDNTEDGGNKGDDSNNSGDNTEDGGNGDNGDKDEGETNDGGLTDAELAAMGAILEEAYALTTGTTMSGTHTLAGKITNIKEIGPDEACLTFVVQGYDGYPMYCYWLKGAAADELAVGDFITVSGTIKNYKNTIEFDKPTLVSFIKGEREPLEVTTTAGTGIAEGYQVISIEMAKEICAYTGETVTTDRYYIHATIDSISNAQYGKMVISDATGSISVYGTYSADGEIGYAAMTEKPLKGAEVLLSCTLHSFDDSPEVKNARLIAFKEVELDESAYTEMTIAQAREKADGELVKVSGVVAQITYANGMVPNGVYLVDNTNSIYIYDRDLAALVEKGNTITVLGEKTHWILDTEMTSAAKFGYDGCNQIQNAWLLENDGEKTEYDKTWIQETTIKEIMQTPVTENITTTLYKVTALVKESQGDNFINYYIDDLDEKTGSYVYTQCNGNDLDWMKAYDNKICTVYLSVINAKSTPSSCVWRFSVIDIEDNGYQFDLNDAPKFVVEYYAIDQFDSKYVADPALEVTTSVSSALLGFENATISYTSSDEDIIYFETIEGVTKMHCGSEYGNATITITGEYNGIEYSETKVISYIEQVEIPSITVAEAIATAPDTENVVVKGIVGPSLVNQKGFYLFGEDGSMIAVKVANAEEAFAGLAIGHEVIVKGMRERYINDDTSEKAGQTCIVNAEILQNNFGNHEYSTEKFVTGKTVADLYALDYTVDYSTTVFIVTGKLYMPETNNAQPSIQDANGNYFSFYCNGQQYSWLNEFKDQEITIEVAACNWNNKPYWRGCVLAVYTEDGKVLNQLNFNS